MHAGVLVVGDAVVLTTGETEPPAVGIAEPAVELAVAACGDVGCCDTHPVTLAKPITISANKRIRVDIEFLSAQVAMRVSVG
ncbi:hypothetical protein MBOU_35740 [Mycobacterium bourgelatii]|uniref:Uncharacterized protein n=1 Tax=Mycobacterium bourgelatii TaxID=1273442 RepID=A0A7I9YSL8_MYCBU|nr:hypothetical protein MBOU_35740 [Mycobacterium bourgelatii]